MPVYPRRFCNIYNSNKSTLFLPFPCKSFWNVHSNHLTNKYLLLNKTDSKRKFFVTILFSFVLLLSPSFLLFSSYYYRDSERLKPGIKRKRNKNRNIPLGKKIMARYRDADFSMPDIEVGIGFLKGHRLSLVVTSQGLWGSCKITWEKIDQLESTVKTWAIIRRMHLLKSCLMYYHLTKK